MMQATVRDPRRSTVDHADASTTPAFFLNYIHPGHYGLFALLGTTDNKVFATELMSEIPFAQTVHAYRPRVQDPGIGGGPLSTPSSIPGACGSTPCGVGDSGASAFG
jgi:hypothetical protein